MSQRESIAVMEQAGGGRRRRRKMPTADLQAALRYQEMSDVVALLGRPHTTAHLGLRRVVAYWTIKRQWVEVIFDEHGRAERITLT